MRYSDSKETDARDYQVLLLPSGAIILASQDEEDNGPGCLHVLSSQ
jgi:hypothetical protein